jgi:hypothetical protein
MTQADAGNSEGLLHVGSEIELDAGPVEHMGEPKLLFVRDPRALEFLRADIAISGNADPGMPDDVAEQSRQHQSLRALPGRAIGLELEKLLFVDKRWRVRDAGLFGDVDDCL